MKIPDWIRGLCLLIGVGIVLSLVAGPLLMRSSTSSRKAEPMPAAAPVTLTLWHYYNGPTKSAFDDLTSRFNATEGARHGVVVQAHSLGDVSALAEAVFRAARGDMGAPPLPDIFAAYPDNACRVAQLTELADLEPYFTPDDMAAYHPPFLKDGRVGPERRLLIFPVAKSTENLFINRTAWDAFAADTGASLDDLGTWEGVARTAGRYYEWSGGRAFFRLDSLANFGMVAARQLGETPFDARDGQPSPILPPRFARALWDTYHVPFVRGWYAKRGPFCTDDARTQTIIAYIGSSAGAGYFPVEVSEGGSPRSIVCTVLPYPRFEGGRPSAMLQGAGLCVAKSTPERERAAALFLRWLTQPEQNIPFAALTGYLPVVRAGLREAIIRNAAPDTAPASFPPAVAYSLRATLTMLDEMELANEGPFAENYALRTRWNTLLPECAEVARAELLRRTAAGEDQEAVLADMLSENAFRQWLDHIEQESAAVLRP